MVSLYLGLEEKHNQMKFKLFNLFVLAHIFVYSQNTVEWTGMGFDHNWTTAGNWAGGQPPGMLDTAYALFGDFTIVVDDDVIINRFTNIEGTITLVINAGKSLECNEWDAVSSGTITLNSDSTHFASFICEGPVSNQLTYNRWVNSVNAWDLVGSPVDGLSISSFVSTNSSPIATSGTTYALGYHDNTNDTWTNYTTSVGNDVNFDSGRGYQMAATSGATMAFTGSILTTNQTQSIINSDSNGSGGRRWNLVANPFPSYINLNTNAHATNNFLYVNSSVVDGNYLAVYGYDADGTGYTIYNNTIGDNLSDYIAPGQAFFVAAASSSAADISFTTAMRTTSGGDDFVSGRLAQSTHSSFYLKLYEGDDFIADSKFYFDNGLTLGLDPGYDAGALDQNMAIMSRLPQQDQGIGMSINAMSNESFEETIIPLDINKEAGIPFRISLEDATIPEGVEVYLEDTQQQTITDLKDVDFTLTPESDLSGIGRFYVRLGNTNLGNNDLTESHISIYKPFNQDHITIEGLANIKTAKVSLFNIIGQEVLNQPLSSNQSTQTISTNGLVIGVYIIKLIADNVTITKKLIIN